MRKKVRVSSNRLVRHLRIRKRIFGTAEKPRLTVFRSLRHLEAQLVNDLSGKTIVSASTRDKNFKSKLKNFGNVQAASELGKYLAQKTKAKGIQSAAFDRAGYLYHGRVKALADSLRKDGLKI